METNRVRDGAPAREIELDFLRGIAILLVLDFHSPAGLLFSPFRWLGFKHFGWAGVDIFFVLSGFLVGGLLTREWKLRGRVNARRFLIRRGFKIWPPYYVFLLVMLVTGHRSFSTLLGNLLNIQNYLGGVAHTWSLAVEEHAYLLLVLCLAVAAHVQARMRTLFFFFAGITVCVVLSRLFLATHGLPFFNATHTRIDGILEGVLLAVCYHYQPEIFRRLQSWRAAWFSVLAAVLLFFRFADQSVPWITSVGFDCANAMGVALLMLLYRPRPGHVRPRLYRLVAWIGLYSYGIYLWHVALEAPISRASADLPAWAVPLWLGIVPILGGIVVGVIFTKLVEFPALRLRDRLFPRQVGPSLGAPVKVEAIASQQTHLDSVNAGS